MRCYKRKKNRMTWSCIILRMVIATNLVETVAALWIIEYTAATAN